jgi:hypothetical protein
MKADFSFCFIISGGKGGKGKIIAVEKLFFDA